MEWADDLRNFRESIETISQQRSAVPQDMGEQELEERLRLIQEAFEELRPEAYLTEMNRVLLDGRGELELYLPWDDEEEEDDEEFEAEWEEVDDEGLDDDDDEDEFDDDDEDDEELEEQDVASAILVWDDGDDGQCELAIDVGLEDSRIYWQVNGEDVPTNDRALREALKKAYADEIGL